ncbi:unnamed protein product [Rhizoctonia solani]|uniref:Peptidase C14 caspase domain-containing protein n=1 Tax=Rhizoctonia solani TaxID=456999 RepID=A0A8H3A6A2_9AGAM|nr:unnamed protein product [Rhizoctonia solani]
MFKFLNRLSHREKKKRAATMDNPDLESNEMAPEAKDIAVKGKHDETLAAETGLANNTAGPSGSTSAPPAVPEAKNMEVESNHPSKAVIIQTNPASKLHALIIGINAYPNLPNLKGAVADADEIANFLTSESELNVPPNQVHILRDKSATRQEIIRSFRSLQGSESIKPGDPILIYYAGYGGLRKATDKWKEAGGAHEVQVIFPYDYDTKIDNLSNYIEPIPDRTIVGLLNELSKAKGDNITVIFDSCHATSATTTVESRAPHPPPPSSATRDPTKPKTGVADTGPKKGAWDRLNRSAEVKREIPWDIDSDIVNPKLGLVPPPEKDEMRRTDLPLCVNQTSHIHLAACGSNEQAWEEDGRGVFTIALLKCIRANGIDKITYRDLIKSMPILSGSQSPNCYGKHKGRILFNSGVPSPKTVLIPVKIEEEDAKVVLQAGAASGVTTDSIWEIYDSVTGKALGRFRAESPDVSTVVLKLESSGEDSYLAPSERPPMKFEGSGAGTYARQVRAGVTYELRVYFTPAAKERIFQNDGAKQTASYLVGSGVDDVGYVVHPAEDSADIAVDLYSEREVSFRLCDRQAERYGVAKRERRVRAERKAVDEALFGAAKWKWHLERKNESGETTNPVTMELITMGTMTGKARMMYPAHERKSISTAGIADFQVRQQDLYGVELTSRIDKPLYVRMFYFDTTDFSIADMFGHTVGRDRVIDAGGTFIIGDNRKGGSPLRFTLNPSEVLDLGYMKVFWSTEPLELEGLQQRPNFNRSVRKWARLRGASRDIDERIEWGTALLTLVQRLPDTIDV